MTIKELKEIIKDLDDNMEVGGSGHFGEFLDCYDVTVSSVSEGRRSNKFKKILLISMESAGEEPD